MADKKKSLAKEAVGDQYSISLTHEAEFNY